MKYENKATGYSSEHYLNDYGREGWELVAVTSNSDYSDYAYLKRPLEATPSELMDALDMSVSGGIPDNPKRMVELPDGRHPDDGPLPFYQDDPKGDQSGDITS